MMRKSNLLHSDNYIPANPMQTPPSIGNFPVSMCFSILTSTATTEDPDADVSDDMSGTVLINEDLVSVTKFELLNMLNKAGQREMPFDTSVFQSLVNGVFQAEGHWGGYFPSLHTSYFRPLWFISQNASTESIQFFGYLMQAIKGPFMTYHFGVTVTGQWHIRIQTQAGLTSLMLLHLTLIKYTAKSTQVCLSFFISTHYYLLTLSLQK